MDDLPGYEQVENPNQAENYNLADLDNRINNAEEALPTDNTASPAGSMDSTQPPTDQTAPNPPEKTGNVPAKAPDVLNPQTGFGEKGMASKIETGAEKPEVKYFHPSSPEGGY